jgi:hypothetical protein
MRNSVALVVMTIFIAAVALAGSQAGPQIRERGHGISEEHHSETRNHQLGAELTQRQLRGIAEPTGRVGEWAQAFCRQRQHGPGNIDSDDASGRADGAGEFDRRGAAPAPDIDDRRSATWRCKCKQRRDKGNERPVEAILVIGPVFAVVAIPARALFFIESLCRCHKWTLSF